MESAPNMIDVNLTLIDFARIGNIYERPLEGLVLLAGCLIAVWLAGAIGLYGQRHDSREKRRRNGEK